MEATLNRDLSWEDIPPFSYTGIAHTFKNSPYNEYPYAMARLRWFTDSFDPDCESSPLESRLTSQRSILQLEAKLNGNFTYLQAADANLVDSVLDTVYRELTGEERDARELGPHEPGIGQWVNHCAINQRYWLDLPPGRDRRDLLFLLGERLAVDRAAGAPWVDGIYLYPPDYGDDPGGQVRHDFRVFGQAISGDKAPVGDRLRETVEAFLAEISFGSV